MFIHVAYIVPILITVSHARQTTLSFQDGFRELGMIPRFVENPPNVTCQVIYPFGRVKPGSYLMPDQVKAIPKVTWPIEAKTLYCLFMAGMEEPYVEEYDHYQADVPEIRLREWEQWVVINIPGRNVSKGLTLYEYITPHPAWKNQTSNRYAFFIFKQKYKIVEYMKADSEGFAYMETISVSKFISDHNLNDPIAGNYFLIRWNPDIKYGFRTPRSFISVTFSDRQLPQTAPQIESKSVENRDIGLFKYVKY